MEEDKMASAEERRAIQELIDTGPGVARAGGVAPPSHRHLTADAIKPMRGGIAGGGRR